MRIVAGTHKHRLIEAPKGLTTRPTSERLREALFNICQSYIEGADFLDLFAGSGAMGLEALSRGANSATFVDNHRESIRVIKKNLQNLDLEDKGIIFQEDAFDYIDKVSKRGKSYNIIYADPPYEMQHTWKGVRMTCSNHLIQAIDTGTLLMRGGALFLEEAINAQPDLNNLHTLKLISSRRMGRSTLLQFEKS